MRKDYEKLFFHFRQPELPNGLLDRVINRINKERKLISVRRRLVIFSFIFIASIAAFVPALKMVEAELANSRFVEFFSLLFSDTNIVMAYWQNFVLSLLEALPVTSLIILLFVMFMLLESAKALAKNIKIFYSNTVNKISLWT